MSEETMKSYFFGVRSANDKGHFLFTDDAKHRLGAAQERLLPFRLEILDGGLLPPQGGQPHGVLYLSHINGWTILSMWDRSADTRLGSNASFLVEGEYNMDEMMVVASSRNPNIWARIQAASSP